MCIKLFHGRKKQDDKLKLVPEIREADKSDLISPCRLVSNIYECSLTNIYQGI